jgi:hypothetical protein
MKLVRELKMSNPFYLIITGDGSGDFKTFEALCEKYNGHHKTLWFPVLGLKKKTGLSALDSIKDFPGDFGINSGISSSSSILSNSYFFLSSFPNRISSMLLMYLSREK